MLRAPDADGIHPVIEQFAADLYLRTSNTHWPVELRGDQGAWRHISPELRAWFRDRARSFAAGDMRVAPWRLDGKMGPS